MSIDNIQIPYLDADDLRARGWEAQKALVSGDKQKALTEVNAIVSYLNFIINKAEEDDYENRSMG